MSCPILQLLPKTAARPATADETEAFFIIRDRNRQALAYVYFEYEPGLRTAAGARRAGSP